MDMDEIISQFSEEMPSDFNPDDYSIEGGISISSPTENGEMPRYTIEDLKVDIEPMLFDLSSEEVNELIRWILESRSGMNDYKNQQGSQPIGGEMVAQEEIPDFQPFENTDVDYLSMLQ